MIKNASYFSQVVAVVVSPLLCSITAPAHTATPSRFKNNLLVSMYKEGKKNNRSRKSKHE